MQKQDFHNAIEAAGLKVLEIYNDDSGYDHPHKQICNNVVISEKNSND
jgi:hypothetical protein